MKKLLDYILQTTVQKIVLIGLLMINYSVGFSQYIDLDEMGSSIKESKPFRMAGGVTANNIFYQGNDAQDRQPYTYLLSGNVNINIYNQINLPFSFNLNNLGANFTYPNLSNRISIHPNYKWITAHIGDVSMTFSPYTLNGHQFSGAGVDLSPEGPWKISAMAGRLQKKVEYDTANPYVPTAYYRFGFGSKVRYEVSNAYYGMSFFSAKEDPNTLNFKPDSLGITPRSNVAFSWEAGLKLTKKLSLYGEYGLSLLTRDVRSQLEGSSLINRFFNTRTSTQNYTAFKMGIDYQTGKHTFGSSYERIAPDYQTLGAYYFNNDYENMTLNYALLFLQDKADLAVSWGLQRDNLDENNDQTSKRVVGSLNLNYSPDEQWSFFLSYSSFQTYMNIRSQFDYINSVTPYDNLDTLNFTQLSQNLSLNTVYNFGNHQDRKNSINANISFQEAADKQGDIIQRGNLSRFYNANLGYSLTLVPQGIHFFVSYVTTYNHREGDGSLFTGPTWGVNAKMLKKKLTAGISSAYNINLSNNEKTGEVLNIRLNALYRILTKHSLRANIIWQNRYFEERQDTQSITATIAYSYNF